MWYALVVRQRRKQHMHMIRHHDHRFEIDSLAVVMQAMRQNNIARRFRKRRPVRLAEGHKEDAPHQLIMRHPAPVFVFMSKNRGIGHPPISTAALSPSS